MFSATLSRFRSPYAAVAETIYPRRGADEETIAGERGRGHAHVVVGEFVGVEQLEPVAGAYDVAHAVFVQAENLSGRGPRRGGERKTVGQALAVVAHRAGFCVVATQQATVVENIEAAVIDHRARIVGRGGGMAPGDERVAGLVGLERDVAARAGPDCVERARLVAHVAGADEEQAAVGVGRRNGDARHAAQRPEQLAVEAVAGDAARAGGDDLRARAVLPHEGRGPVALLVAGGAPEFLAGALVEREQLGLLVVV